MWSQRPTFVVILSSGIHFFWVKSLQGNDSSMRQDWLAKESKVPAASWPLSATIIGTTHQAWHFYVGIPQALYRLCALSPLSLDITLIKNKSAQIWKVQSNMSLDFKPQKADSISISKCPKYFWLRAKFNKENFWYTTERFSKPLNQVWYGSLQK